MQSHREEEVSEAVEDGFKQEEIDEIMSILGSDADSVDGGCRGDESGDDGDGLRNREVVINTNMRKRRKSSLDSNKFDIEEAMKSKRVRTESSDSMSNNKNVSASMNFREMMAKEFGLGYEVVDLVNEIAKRYVGMMKFQQPITLRSLDQLSQSTKMLCTMSLSRSPLHFLFLRMIRIMNEIYDRHDKERTGLNSTGVNILVLATIYIDRLLELQKDFVLHPLNIRQVFFAAVMAAMKFAEDTIPDKSLLSMIGGIPGEEIGECEKRFCALIRFSFWIDPTSALQKQFDLFCVPLKMQHIVSPSQF